MSAFASERTPRQRSRRNGSRAILLSAVLALIASGLTGCAKEEFVGQSTSEPVQSPGAYYIPPKVDILLAEDDTGSMKDIYGTIAKQLPAFLEQLEKQGWDYHFVTQPLTSDRPFNEVVGSRYDPNWGKAWKAPYPGARPDDITGTLLDYVFRKAADYTGFLTYSEINSAGTEPGLDTITRALESDPVGSGFLRDDAMLVVLVAGNGEDRSQVNLCRRSDGVVVPCEQTGQMVGGVYHPYGQCSSLSQYSPTVDGSRCGTLGLSFNDYKSRLLALKSDPRLIRLYSAVSPMNRSRCLGGRAFAGTRYIQMADALGGESYDICSRSVSSVLTDLTERLQGEKRFFRTKYLFISTQPELSTLKVTVYRDGSGQGEVIPQDANNGWTYLGYRTDLEAIDSPVPMNPMSGYAIELHGSAKLLGNDRADVSYSPYGSTD